MLIKQWECARVGILALGWCVLPDSCFEARQEDHAQGAWACEREKVRKIIDELHLRQIDLADEVFVLNIGGCIDVSTRDEINYAYAQHKPVIYQEAPEFLRIGEY
jgi:nucleoside 2-deoxyribosyltransferase